MYLGRLAESNETAKLFSAPRHPYTKALLESVLTPDPTLGIPETNLGTDFPNPVAPPDGCRFHPRCPQAMAVCSAQAPSPTRCGQGLVECHLYAADSAEEPSFVQQGRLDSHA